MATKPRSEESGEAAEGQPLPANVTLTEDQFQRMLSAVQASGGLPSNVQPPEPPLDLVNDPNVWTWDRVRDLIESGQMRSVTFVPDETVMIGWNGLYTWVTRGEENVVSEAHYNVYMDSRKGTREAFANARGTLQGRSAEGMWSHEVGWVQPASV